MKIEFVFSNEAPAATSAEADAILKPPVGIDVSRTSRSQSGVQGRAYFLRVSD